MAAAAVAHTPRGPACCEHGRLADLQPGPRRRRRRAGATPVPGLLRLRLPCGVAVVGTRPVAPVHDRAAATGGEDSWHPRQSAGRGCDGAVRQGRGVPAAWPGPLPCADPPRRATRLPRLRTRSHPVDASRAWPSWSPRLPHRCASPSRASTQDDPSRTLAFGRQLDARPVRTTRRTDDPGPGPDPGAGGRLPGQVRHQVGQRHRSHPTRPTTAASEPPSTRSTTAPPSTGPRTGDDSYALLGHWSHMLGFRGHFASKSRRYSVTLGGLRRARRRAQALIAQTPARRAGRWTSPPSRPTCSPTRTTRPPWSSVSGTSSVPGGPMKPRPCSPERPPHAPASTTSGVLSRDTSNTTSGDRTR